ncbi:carbohydrate ABC transporter permease [Aureibacillus halotolerans]|uniref:Putative aldouronate transport system permease protein n=1 Tax=Aureibacillus halotolerans TaxID=1508390 RepID=A0A4R6U678_9BACI|nr:carbohydrate ABC transporter permease [Aureibacillus halotolerans]TDQ40363.1 putative aldouronate transport system permease protein [Aureibacillus halotolerans]
MRDSFGDKVFYSVNYILLAVGALTCVFPLIHILAMSLSDSHAVLSGMVTLVPVGWTLESYKLLINGTNIIQAFLNSVTITVLGVIFSMAFTILAAYPLSRKYFIGRSFFTLLLVFTMLFQGGIIPTFLVLKYFDVINTFSAVWILNLVSVFNMLVMRTYFQNIPEEVQESARIDGCNEWKLLIRIILPLSMPVLAALALFYGVGYWNAFMQVLIYINDTSKYNLPVLVQQMIQSQSLMQEMMHATPEDASQMQMTPESVRSAGIIFMVIPMLIVYPFVQKYFVKGVMLGSVKG